MDDHPHFLRGSLTLHNGMPDPLRKIRMDESRHCMGDTYYEARNIIRPLPTYSGDVETKSI